jgi:hypothetical protein
MVASWAPLVCNCTRKPPARAVSERIVSVDIAGLFTKRSIDVVRTSLRSASRSDADKYVIEAESKPMAAWPVQKLLCMFQCL